MKTIILITIALYSFMAFGQDFAPVGAVWYYNQGTINPDLNTYKTFESVLDTSINGIECKKIVESERYIEVEKTVNHYMYEKNDSVFFYADNNFNLLYDFGANKGDTIILEYFDTQDGKLKLIIDSVSTIDINGVERKIQYVTSGDGISIEFANEIIEGIGSSHFLFPTYDNSQNGKLRCYEDDIVGLFKNPFFYGGEYSGECDFITNITDKKYKSQLEIYPNPFSNSIEIVGLQSNTALSIINSNGSIVMESKISQNEKIDLTPLEKGIYFIRIIDGEQIRTSKIIKK